MGILLSFNEAAILYRDFNSALSQKQNLLVFEANNSRCAAYIGIGGMKIENEPRH